MSSAKCAGARPDNDWCSGILLCTLLVTGQEASETGAANAKGCPQDVKSQDRDETETLNPQD